MKQKYNVDSISAIIFDEMSISKAWMIHFDKWLKEARQNYNKPSGGVAVLLLGDFDQQPSIGRSSLPFTTRVLAQS